MQFDRRICSNVIAASLVFGFAGAATAQPIRVTNPGFESPSIALCSFGTAPTGWSFSGDAGLWRPGILGQCLSSFRLGAPEGAQICYTNSPTVSQTLAVNLAANKQYTLRVKVGRRYDCCQPTGASNYRVQLWAGSTMLAEDAGAQIITNGTFREAVVRYGAATGNPAIGQALQIRLVVGSSGQSQFDDVSLVSANADCNNNGILDSVDIANGAPDVNHNGVPDSCEFPHQCVADCSPGITGDGQVNVNDLLAVITAWGACAGCAADIAPAHGNGQVNVNDLLAVITAWGPCP